MSADLDRTIPLKLTLVAELLHGWKGRRSTRERLIIQITEQFKHLPDAVIAGLCDVSEEQVRWLRGDISGRSSITKRRPRGRAVALARARQRWEPLA
jgi:hypothetical protein